MLDFHAATRCRIVDRLDDHRQSDPLDQGPRLRGIFNLLAKGGRNTVLDPAFFHQGFVVRAQRHIIGHTRQAQFIGDGCNSHSYIGSGKSADNIEPRFGITHIFDVTLNILGVDQNRLVTKSKARSIRIFIGCDHMQPKAFGGLNSRNLHDTGADNDNGLRI